MNIDGLTLTVVTKELSSRLLNGQINKIYQIDKTTLLLQIHTFSGSENLIITVGNSPACYLSTGLSDLPKEPSSLSMFLRKHIENARLTTIQQLASDRILLFQADKLDLDGTIVSTTIYVELMGKYSNCIFVQNGYILESLIHVTPLMSQERTIAPKQPFILPPNSNRLSLLEFSAAEIKELLQTYPMPSIGETIRQVFNGVGPQLLDEIMYRSQLHSSDDFLTLSDSAITELANTLASVGKEIANSSTLYKYEVSTKKSIYSPIPLTHSKIRDLIPVIIHSPSIEFATSVRSTGGIQTANQELETLLKQALEKEKKRHQKITNELEDADKADQYKMYGDLLMINAYLSTQYESSITLSNLLVDPPEDIVIPLKPELSIAENAQHYYKRYTKFKNRLIMAQEQLRLSEEKCIYLDSIRYSLSLANDRSTLQEIREECERAGLLKKSKKSIQFKSSKENYLKIDTPDGDIMIGKNNQQNDYLTHRWAKPTDLWFHTLHWQGSHVILRPHKEPTEELIQLAASYAAYYSKAKEAEKVDVDYTMIKFVKKPPASPLGFVTYSNQKTVTVTPKEPK